MYSGHLYIAGLSSFRELLGLILQSACKETLTSEMRALLQQDVRQTVREIAQQHVIGIATANKLSTDELKLTM
jgi:hypothetical protein